MHAATGVTGGRAGGRSGRLRQARRPSRVGVGGPEGQQAPGFCVQKLANCFELVGAELPPVGAELPPVEAGVVEAGVVVVLGAAPPVGAELPPALPVGVLDEPLPVALDEPVDDDVSVELDPLVELEPALPLPVLVESPVVPVAVLLDGVVVLDVPAEFSSLARLADAVGSTRLGTVRGTESETWAPPQAVRASPATSAPSSPAGRARLGKASLRWGPCDARRSGSR